jgi:DNA replicative helicase MCM subunit Mcm2 (Cdc46/Mcm family)
LQRLFRVAEDHGRVDTGRVVRKQHDRGAIAVLDKTLFAVTVDKPFR